MQNVLSNAELGAAPNGSGSAGKASHTGIRRSLFTELSQPFAQRLPEDTARALLLKCSSGPSHFMRWSIQSRVSSAQSAASLPVSIFATCLANTPVLAGARRLTRSTSKIEPPRNSTKPVYSYLLIDPDWLNGSPGIVKDTELGGYADATVEATSGWYQERLENLRLIEVRGRIKLADDTSHLGVDEQTPIPPD